MNKYAPFAALAAVVWWFFLRKPKAGALASGFGVSQGAGSSGGGMSSGAGAVPATGKFAAVPSAPKPIQSVLGTIGSAAGVGTQIAGLGAAVAKGAKAVADLFKKSPEQGKYNPAWGDSEGRKWAAEEGSDWPVYATGKMSPLDAILANIFGGVSTQEGGFDKTGLRGYSGGRVSDYGPEYDNATFDKTGLMDFSATNWNPIERPATDLFAESYANQTSRLSSSYDPFADTDSWSVPDYWAQPSDFTYAAPSADTYQPAAGLYDSGYAWTGSSYGGGTGAENADIYGSSLDFSADYTAGDFTGFLND